MVKIGFITTDSQGVEYHRLIKPFSLLEGFDITMCEGVTNELLDMGFDVVVFSRTLPLFGKQNQKEGNYFKQQAFIKELQKQGVYVICDIDDYWIFDTNHIATHIQKRVFKGQWIDAIINADEVWTTHEHLGNYIDKLNKNWHVIPNAIDPNEAQWKSREDKPRGNRIGWAGGVTHFHDLMLTDGCWGDDYPVICGFKDDPQWIKLADRFRADYVDGMDVWNYGQLYDYFDIAIAPLVDNRFNRCKSNLKIIEAGMKGLPIFVQNIHPYIDDARGIYKVDDWKAAIREAGNMEHERIYEDGQVLRAYCLENYDLNKVNEKRKERLWY